MALEMVGVGHKSFQYRIPYAGSNLIAWTVLDFI
jgi:hypothetical protein